LGGPPGYDDAAPVPAAREPAGTPAFGPLIPEDADLLGGPAEEPWAGASHHDHAPAQQAFFAPPRADVEKIPDDWDAAFPGSAHPPPSRPANVAEPVPARPIAAPAQLPVAAAGGGAADGAAVTAFLAAIGLAGTPLTEADKTRLMRAAGEALAIVVKGLCDVLAARASTKQEFRIERTMIGAAGNNPLKFSGSPDEAVRALFLGKTPGFLPAGRAFEEALNDIKTHQLAVVAGMQAALMTVIARFDPASLEKRIEQHSGLAGILPGARKARYWELFKTLYGQISAELEDDFHKAFGVEFARAYKQQVDRF
jgi:type VI secretion system FHA domain protein